MANHTKTINEATLVSLMEDLETLSRAVKSVKEKLIKLLPVKYGSDLWWEKSIKEGTESIESGRGKKFRTYEEAAKYLNS